MSDRKPSFDREAMRRMVREVLRDALPEVIKTSGAHRATAEKLAVGAPPAARPEPAVKKAPTSPGRVAEEVSLQNDQDLARFVRRLVQLLEDPDAREAVKAGHHQFKLKRPSSAMPAAPSARAASTIEKILKGVVKENTVIDAAKAGARLIIGRGVVVTPLARDKARQLGVQIERDV